MDTKRFIESDKSWSDEEKSFLLSLFSELNSISNSNDGSFHRNSLMARFDNAEKGISDSKSIAMTPQIMNYSKIIKTPMAKVLQSRQRVDQFPAKTDGILKSVCTVEIA